MTKEFDINEVVNEIDKLNNTLGKNKVPHILIVDRQKDDEYCVAVGGSAFDVVRLVSAVIDAKAEALNVPNKEIFEMVGKRLDIETPNEAESLIEDFKKQAAALAKKNLEDSLTPEEFRANVEVQIELAKAITALTAVPKVEELQTLLAAMSAALDDDDDDDDDDEDDSTDK